LFFIVAYHTDGLSTHDLNLNGKLRSTVSNDVTSTQWS